MKKIFFLIIACIMISCESVTKIEKEAKESCSKMLMELAKDPTSVQLTNFRTVYQTDSVCILHLVFSAQNNLGVMVSDEMEYIYYVDNTQKYEVCVNLNEQDSIFLNEEELNKIKQYTFYYHLNYHDAIKHRVITQLNKKGRVVGHLNEPVNLSPLVNTGKWELKYYKNEFGEYTNEKYLTIEGVGTFSNSAATNSELTALLFVEKNSIALRLIEYNYLVVKNDDWFSMKIKDSNENIEYFNEMWNNSHGNIYFYDSKSFGYNYEKILKILQKEGIIRCNGRMSNEYSSSTYTFSFDINGYNEALKYIK